MSENIISKKTEIKIHGYETLEPEITIPKKEALDFISLLDDLDLESRSYYLNLSTKKEITKKAKDFFKRHFKLHPVPYKSSFKDHLDFLTLLTLNNIEICLMFYNLNIKINPFLLPLAFKKDEMACMAVENATCIDNEEFIKKMQISYRKIILSEPITELSEASYVHEITHTELTSSKGIIKKYYNSEVLSIFLELLDTLESSNSNRLLPLEDAIRMLELNREIKMLSDYSQNIKNYDHESLIESSKYSESIIKAYALFSEYYYGTPALRKYILTSIQNIFDGNLSLEELLDEFEITLSTSYKNPNIIKYLKR